MNPNSQGISYADLRKSIIQQSQKNITIPVHSAERKILDSMLARTLDYTVYHGLIHKIQGKYYPSGADFAVPMFRNAMRVVGDALNRSG